MTSLDVIMDEHWSTRLKEECIINNASEGKQKADAILIELLGSMGFHKTAEMYLSIITARALDKYY